MEHYREGIAIAESNSSPRGKVVDLFDFITWFSSLKPDQVPLKRLSDCVKNINRVFEHSKHAVFMTRCQRWLAAGLESSLGSYSTKLANMAAVSLRNVNSKHETDTMFLLLTLAFVSSAASTHQPNIILIVADDLGFNDVSYRGSIDIPTPNIDALAYTGRILDRHYVLPTCTPSRTALLTGKYPVRTGMQGFPLKTGENRSLSAEVTLLPQYLKRLNYSTHLIGKWHQGSYRQTDTPLRAFDSFFGYYHGYIGYYNHDTIMSDYKPTAKGELPPIGIDLHRDNAVALDVQGIYATELFTREAERLIRQHSKKTPLFVDLSHLAVHTGKDGTEMEVEDEAENNKRFWFIKNPQRRRLAGALTSLDNSVGRIVEALAQSDMLHNTIILFMADNGGETNGIHANAASNYPLRGQKFTQFEGGVRGSAVLWYAGFKPTDELYSEYVHITDWVPSLYEAAGGDVSELDVDGVSQWGKLTGRETKAPRTELLVNSEHLVDNESLLGRSYIDGPWKLVWGVLYPQLSTHQGEPGETVGAQPYDLNGVITSKTCNYLLSASKLGKEGLMKRADRLRNAATLPKHCRKDATEEVPTCIEGCLFNVVNDPCETRDVSTQHPDIVAQLKVNLEAWQEKTVPQLNRGVDPASDPRHYNGTWVSWGDVQPYVNVPKEQHEPINSNDSSPDNVFSLVLKLWCQLSSICQ